MKELVVVYKFGKRFDGELSPQQGINFYYLHAQANEGKVLFTVDKCPRVELMDYIHEIILMTADGTFAIHAKVNAVGKYSVLNPPEDYLVPSIWNSEKREKKCWFALQDLEKITIQKGVFTTTSGNDLLAAMSGRGYMAYIEKVGGNENEG